MKKIVFSAACLMLGLASVAPAHAQMPPGFSQKDMMGGLYMLKIAPTVCKWSNVGDTSKIDTMLSNTEKQLSVTADEKAAFMKTAESTLKAAPQACDMLRPSYDAATK